MKEKNSAALLAIFLGGIGIHRFYVGQTGLGILYLLFVWTGIPFFVGLLDGIIWLTWSKERFDNAYNYKRPVSAPAPVAPAPKKEVVPAWKRLGIAPDSKVYEPFPNIVLVAGLKHHDYEQVSAYLKKDTELSLEREPDNQYDENAVRVLFKGVFLGYIPAEMSEEVAYYLDEGYEQSVKVYNHHLHENIHERLTITISLYKQPTKTT